MHEARDCVREKAGSDPQKTCGFLAQQVFLRHTCRAGRSRLIHPWREDLPSTVVDFERPPRKARMRPCGDSCPRRNRVRCNQRSRRRSASVITSARRKRRPIRHRCRPGAGMDSKNARRSPLSLPVQITHDRNVPAAVLAGDRRAHHRGLRGSGALAQAAASRSSGLRRTGLRNAPTGCAGRRTGGPRSASAAASRHGPRK